MAAAMAIDLGIHKSAPSDFKIGGAFDIFNISTTSFVPDRKSMDPDAHEAKRTLLGCYYLTSS